MCTNRIVSVCVYMLQSHRHIHRSTRKQRIGRPKHRPTWCFGIRGRSKAVVIRLGIGRKTGGEFYFWFSFRVELSEIFQAGWL